MRTPRHIKKSTFLWVRKAEGDFRAAKILCEMPQSPGELWCFHCQQCVEKYVQALLEEARAAGPRIHDLTVLHDMVLHYDSTLASFRRGMIFITQFADDDGFPVDRATARQARSAMRWTTRIREAIRARLSLPI